MPASLTDRTVAAGREALAGRRRGLRGFLPFAGPAVIASIAYMDPGNFATNIQGGAQFGYLLLWVVLLANLVAMLFQALSAKLGIVTGQSLAQLCRSAFPPPAGLRHVGRQRGGRDGDRPRGIAGRRHRPQPAVRPAAADRPADHLRPDLRHAAAAGPRLPADRDADRGVHRRDRRLLPDRAVRRPARLARLRLPRRGAAARRPGQRHAGGRHHRRHRDAARDLPAFQPDPGPHAGAHRRRTPAHHRLLQPRGAVRPRHRRRW